MFKKHKGASLIIAMMLTVLILIFSLNMVQTIQSIQGNVKRSLDAGDFEAAQESAEQKADSLANDGHDRRIIVTVGDNEVEQEVWSSTGCPIPSAQDFGTPVGGITDYSFSTGDTTESILDYCSSLHNLSFGNAYFVYPTPVVFNNVNQRNNLVGSNCDSATIHTTHSDYDSTNAFDPIDHPCYWGRLSPGQSIRIPLNKFGWALSKVDNLKLRLRTPCADGSEWCEDSQRLPYNVQLRDNRVDDSKLIATWVLEVNKGEKNYTSSKGSPNYLSILRNVCDEYGIEICRDSIGHSEITQYRLRNGIFTVLSDSFLNLRGLLSDQGLSVLDISTNNEPTLRRGVVDFFSLLINDSYDSAPVDLIITNITRSEAGDGNLEFQLLSNRRIPRK